MSERTPVPECKCAASKYIVVSDIGEWVTCHASGQITRGANWCPRCGEKLNADGTHEPNKEQP